VDFIIRGYRDRVLADGTGDLKSTVDTLLKALIASVLPEGRRNLAFGLFYLGYGGGWLGGSVTTGLLYEHSRTAIIVFSVAVQLASVPFFVLAARTERSTRNPARRA
jgi:MFS family permease